MNRPLFVLSGLLAAGFASAQNAFDYHVADVGLLQARSIQDDVGITVPERNKMNQAAAAHKARIEAYQKQLQALGATTMDPARLRGIFETLKKDVVADITPAQLTRLRELTLQRLGVVALTDDVVAKKVGMSPAQVAMVKKDLETGKAKFMALQQSMAAPVLAPYKDRKPKSQAEATALRAEIQDKLKAVGVKLQPQLIAMGKTTDGQMLSVLNPKQQAIWNALKGRPFKGK